MFEHGFPSHWSTIRKLMWLKRATGGGASSIWKTVTGALIHITDALASPVQALSVAIEPQQSGSGDPSPDNVRPITGCTGANVWHTGKNLYNPQSILSTFVQEDGSFTLGTGTGNTIIETGQTSSSATISLANLPKLLWLPAGTYTVSAKISTTGSYTVGNVRKVASDGSQTAFGASIESNNGFCSCTFTLDSATRVCFRLSQNNLVYNDFMVERSETATTYEAYSGTKTTISWQTEAGTVYGGTLDVVNGELTSTKGKIVLNGNETETWTAVNGAFYAEVLPEGYALDSQDDWICNKYKPVTKIPKSAQIADRDNLTIFNQNNYERRVFIKDTSITSVSDLQASLASNPVEIVFTLPTSSEYTVTPVSVSTLAGENNIWADVNGEITLTYQAVPETAFSDEADKGMADYMTLTE